MVLATPPAFTAPSVMWINFSTPADVILVLESSEKLPLLRTLSYGKRPGVISQPGFAVLLRREARSRSLRRPINSSGATRKKERTSFPHGTRLVTSLVLASPSGHQ